ncbi:MAG: hypothetical protein F7C34_02280 [Desulfurococcales archaeon]|nr:hypothetical protein [Desulfurococcales archaeon]
MRALTPLALIALLVLSVLTYSASAVTEDTARQTFQQLGCTSCHNGVKKKDWNGIVNDFRSWGASGEYGSVDEAVAAHTGYNSLDQLLRAMANKAGANYSDVQPIKEYLTYVFNEAKTASQTSSQQQTATGTASESTTTTTQAEQGKTSYTPIIAGIAIIIIAIAVVALLRGK